MDDISSLLTSEYGITTNALSPVSGGFSAKAAYRAADAEGIEYFVKVYDKSLPTTKFFVERIDAYMPVLARLSASPTLRGRVLTPIPTRSGTYKAETDRDVYVLFLYVRGVVPGIQGMTRKQTIEMAEILALLHDAGDTIQYEIPGLAEDISLSFCDQLIKHINTPGTGHDALYNLLSPHTVNCTT